MLTRVKIIHLTPPQWTRLLQYLRSFDPLEYPGLALLDQVMEFTATGRSLQPLMALIGVNIPPDSSDEQENWDSTLIRLVPQTWHQFFEHPTHTIESWVNQNSSSADR